MYISGEACDSTASCGFTCIGFVYLPSFSFAVLANVCVAALTKAVTGADRQAWGRLSTVESKSGNELSLIPPGLAFKRSHSRRRG